jgi:hypothetical protein
MAIISYQRPSDRVVYLIFQLATCRIVLLRQIGHSLHIKSSDNIIYRLKMNQNQAPNAADAGRQQAEENICSICLEPVTDPLSASACGHTFCSECFRPWLAMNNRCPNCRSFLPEGTIPQSEYFEYANESTEHIGDLGTPVNTRLGRPAMSYIRDLLARENVEEMTESLQSLDEIMMDLFQDMSTTPSPNSRQVMRSTLRARDTITYEIDILSTTHNPTQLSDLTLSGMATFHNTVNSIRGHINELELAIETLWENVDVRRRTSSRSSRRARLRDQWHTLSQDIIRLAARRTTAVRSERAA